MAWEKPLFSRSKVDRAGKILVEAPHDSVQYAEALLIVNNWRGSHYFPLNEIKAILRKEASKIDKSVLIAQRHKRLHSITGKLSRISTMSLSRMQDIGGCRAIVKDIKSAKKLKETLIRSGFKECKIRMDDYISNPKSSGYRGIHLIYEWKSESESEYDRLSIEVQIRTRVQHSWATAVETVGTFIKCELKNSEGPDEWKDYFKYASSGFAILEESPVVPGTPNDWIWINRELRSIGKFLNAYEKLWFFSSSLKHSPEKKKRNTYYYLMVLKPDLSDLELKTYTKAESAKAQRDCKRLENHYLEETDVDIVLVSVKSLNDLKKAYPNYFADTKKFFDNLEKLNNLWKEKFK